MAKRSLILIITIVAVAAGAFVAFSGQIIRANNGSQGTAPITPLLPNAPLYQCPVWMDNQTCTLLKASCGNGICDAHERCSTCVLDCGCGGALLCNPETGKCYSPAIEDVDMIAGICPAPLNN